MMGLIDLFLAFTVVGMPTTAEGEASSPSVGSGTTVLSESLSEELLTMVVSEDEFGTRVVSDDAASIEWPPTG